MGAREGARGLSSWREEPSSWSWSCWTGVVLAQEKMSSSKKTDANNLSAPARSRGPRPLLAVALNACS